MLSEVPHVCSTNDIVIALQSAFLFASNLWLVSLCRADELYAQKLKYKAISEELDHALNDMTSM